MGFRLSEQFTAKSPLALQGLTNGRFRSASGRFSSPESEPDSFGRIIRQTGSFATSNPLQYSSKWWDQETGLGYWGYRWYEPENGRWVSQDIAAEGGGNNLYAYTLNNSITISDATGLKAWVFGGYEPQLPAILKYGAWVDDQNKVIEKSKKDVLAAITNSGNNARY